MSKSLTEKQLQCLIALYGTATMVHGLTASQVGIECGQPKEKASSWACPKLFGLIQKGLTIESDHGYHITDLGERVVDNGMFVSMSDGDALA